MAIVIQMPKLGHTMTEGKVLQWHKREGEAVREGELVLTIESDKTEVEIESPGAGVMGRLSAGAGDVVAVGGRLGVIEQAVSGGGGGRPPGGGLAPPPIKPRLLFQQQRARSRPLLLIHDACSPRRAPSGSRLRAGWTSLRSREAGPKAW
jgi:pyruvate/2-oxoglutarate dehydrogenase complex dihydrolipoamide acyltransferase (E2) component